MEFHENRAKQPFIGFVLLRPNDQKMVDLRQPNATDFAANER